MKRVAAILLFIGLPLAVEGQQEISGLVGGGCDGCVLMFAGIPNELNWETTVADKSEPGEPLEISGIIYAANRRTPSPNIIMYVYQTDASGYYSPGKNQTVGKKHGHLRGWMKTDEKGRYKFRTIKPAPYPQQRIPAHIHPVIKESDKNEYFIDDFVFEGDPFLTGNERSGCDNRGGSGIIKLKKNKDGVWMGKRNIVLGLNIQNYPKR